MNVGESITLPNKEHGIKEAVLTFFFKEPIDQVDSFPDFYEENLKSEFDKYEEVRTFEFEFSVKNNSTTPKEQKLAGYKLYNNPEVHKDSFFQFVNEKNRQFLSIHVRDYISWKFFRSNALFIMSKITPILKGEIVAFNLYYLDELKVKHGKSSEILNDLFRQESDLLPSGFFKSENSFLAFNTERRTNAEGLIYHDKIELKVQNGLINIGHSTIMPMIKKAYLENVINDDDILKSIEWAHMNNKALLRDVLSSDVQDFIGLNK